MTERTRGSGELEAEVVAILRRSGSSMSAAEIQEQCSGHTPAYTTVLTILDRLGAKGLVEREARSPRRVRFRAVRDDVEHATDTITGALDATIDRRAVLLRFAGALDAQDADVLRRALER